MSRPDARIPRYQCHKKVWALKIKEIKSESIVPAEEGYTEFEVDSAYMKKHNPQVGGYYVVYDDGYKSFSPAEAFEAGYTRIER